MVNATLVRAVMEHIAANPDTWHQHHLIGENDCGTTYCFAGHTLLLSGGKVNDYWHVASTTAKDLLGLSEAQAEKIFMYFPETQIEEELRIKGEFMDDPGKYFGRRFELMCKRVGDVTGVDCMDLAYQVTQ